MKTHGSTWKEVDTVTSINYSPFRSRDEAGRSATIWMCAVVLMLLVTAIMMLIAFPTMPEHGKVVSGGTACFTIVFALYRLWRAERVLYRTRPMQ